MPGVGYDPYNSTQQALLSALSLSEVGSASNALNLGTGGFDLSQSARDQYGFPVWDGTGGSHAAGLFQFQPGTWDRYAADHGLNFQSAADQKAAAWYLAQDTYAQETGGDLMSALKAGDFASIEAALGRTQWIGARGKLASYLGSGKGASLPDETNPVSEDTSNVGDMLKRMNPFRNPFVDPVTGQLAAGGTLARILLFVVGSILLLAAVWWLLSDARVVPSPGSVAKTAVKVAAVA